MSYAQKNPAKVINLAGFVLIVEVILSSLSGLGGSNPLSSQSFALFTTTKFARFFIAFFQFQAFKKAVVLNLFLQNAHCFFNIIVYNPDFNVLQIPRPLLVPRRITQCKLLPMVNLYFFIKRYLLSNFNTISKQILLSTAIFYLNFKAKKNLTKLMGHLTSKFTKDHSRAKFSYSVTQLFA